MLPQRLLEEFSPRAIAPDTLFLLCAKDAMEVVARCIQEGYTVLGVEAFRITDQGAFQPDQRYSNDIADRPQDQGDFVVATTQLISRGGAIGLRFQVAVEEHSQLDHE